MVVDLAAILPLPEASGDSAFAPLAGEASVVRVARAMRGVAVVAAAEPLVARVRETLAAQELSDIAVVTADGPGTRARCLAAGLQHLSEPCHVLVHDIRRPLVPASLRDRVIGALLAGGSVVMPMLPVTDSVKAVDVSGSVIDTLDRSMLRAVQHPRGFTGQELARLLAGATSDDFDELAESLRTGAPITLVDGDADAFVVELPRDTAFLEAIIAER